MQSSRLLRLVTVLWRCEETPLHGAVCPFPNLMNAFRCRIGGTRSLASSNVAYSTSTENARKCSEGLIRKVHR